MSSAASMIYPNNDVPTRTTHQRCQRRNSLPRTFPSQHNKCTNNIGSNHRKQYCLSDCFDPINVAASTVSATTSTVSLHYISQFLTPDTLILPGQFSFAKKPSSMVSSRSPSACPSYSNSDHLHHAPPTNLCHHHHHHHHSHHLHHHQDNFQQQPQQHYNNHLNHQQQHQIHLDMAMVSESGMAVNAADHCGTDSAVDAATAQLEEIIRLCRTLQTKTNNNNNNNNTANASTVTTNDQNQYYPHCSGCCNIHVGCRCSADCVQYFIRNEEFMADMTKAVASMAVMKAAEPSPSSVHTNSMVNVVDKTTTMLTINGDNLVEKPTKLPESNDDLKRSTRNNMDNNDDDDDDDGGVEPCQLLLSNMDSGNGNDMHKMETNNHHATTTSVLSTTVRSTPTIHPQHLQPKQHPHRNIEVNVNNNNNNNNNCNNNGSSHFVTELVAKFEDKKNNKKKCSPPPPPSAPTRSSTTSSPPSSCNLPSTSASQSTPPTTISSPSLLDTMKNNNHNHNHNNGPFRDKHHQTADTFSEDDNHQHQQKQPKSTTVLSTTVGTNLNANRVQLPQSTTTLSAMQPTSSSDLIQEKEGKKCDSVSDFLLLNNKKNNINQPTTKIRPTIKPKPPPKPSSLMLLSASSNSPTINATNKSVVALATNPNEDNDDKCQKVLSLFDDQQKSSKTIRCSSQDRQGSVKHPSLVPGKEDTDADCVVNGATKYGDDQSSSPSPSPSSLSSPPSVLPDPLICHSSGGGDKIGIHGIQDNNKNTNGKRIDGNIDEMMMEMLPSSLTSQSIIGNMPESVDDSKPLCPVSKSNDLDHSITVKNQESNPLDLDDDDHHHHHPKPSSNQSNNKCQQSYCCCCCCCPSSGHYGTCSNNGNNNNKLLGIDLTKIHSINNNNNTHNNKLKPSPTRKLPSSSTTNTTTTMNHCTSAAIVVDADSDLIRQDHHHHHRHLAKQQPNLGQSSPITETNQSSFGNHHAKGTRSTKCSNDSDVLVIVGDEVNSDEQSGPGSSSDNSSSDEGIENPAILDDDEEDIDEDEDEVDLLNQSNKLTAIDTNSSCHYPNNNNNNNNNRRNHSSSLHSHHSHHQHHFNHHNQLVINHHHHHHQPDPSTRKSPSLSFKSNRTVSPLFPHTTNPDDVHQAEKFLNGTDSKHLNQLKQDEALLLKEIFELESEQSETTTATTSLDHNEDVDEELLEFQRIEREIKLSELRKCLQIVQKQIKTYQSKLEQEIATDLTTTTNIEDFDSITMATTATNSDSSLLNEHHQLDQAQQQVEKNINTLVQSRSSAMAPLAEPEMDEVSKTDSLEPEVAIINPELDLSDSDESDAEEVLEPTTPIGENHIHHQQRSLDDLLHESIETRLEKVNDITEQEQESFVANPAKPEESSSSLTRRTSRYDNEKPHDCRMKHFGYHRNVDMLMLKSVYQKLDLDKYDSETDIKHMMNASSISNEMLESTTTATDSETDSIVLRRRSARFPADDSTNDSNPHLQSQDELSTHSDQPVLRNKRISAVSSNSSTAVGGGNGGGSQRPLTLYMPAPNQKINLITHLHALGHDLTSSIVTNHLLLTPYTCSGYLYKHCSSGVGKWRKRYFHFDRVRKVFVYYHDRADFEKMRHPKRGVFFDEIQDVYVDHTRINMKKFLSNSGNDKHSNLSNQQKYGSPGAMTSPAKADGTRCVFVVSTATFSRKFILSTFTPELMRIWMDVIFTGAQAYLQDFDDQLMN